ncbi:MAG: lipid-A-disaccharide synthase [Terriglobales bacterium]
MPDELMIVAGEASGDLNAALLISELRRQFPELRVFGCGGDALQAAGCELLVDASELAVVGLFEVVRHLPRIHRLYRRLRTALRSRRPRGLVLVDFPDFNLRLARDAHTAGIPVVYFISPQLWAWRSGRVRQIRRHVRRMLCIFPFEEAFYARHGVAVDYVGHPLVDLVRPREPREAFFARHGLDPSIPLIALLPGSRRRELDFHLPILLEAARGLQASQPVQFVLPLAPTLDGDEVAQRLAAEPGLVQLIRDGTYDAVAHARLAIVASGTATVETALLRTPMVVIYRLSPWTYALGRRLVKTPYYAMVNLIVGQRGVPELIQDRLTAPAVIDWARQLLVDGPVRTQQLTHLDAVRERLGAPGAIGRAAAAVARTLQMTARPQSPLS